MHGNYSLLPNNVIQKLMHKNLSAFGGIIYSDEELEYAEEIYKTFLKPSLEIGSQEYVTEFSNSHSYGSTDVGDVSWVVPGTHVAVLKPAVGTTQLTSPTSVEP